MEKELNKEVIPEPTEAIKKPNQETELYSGETPKGKENQEQNPEEEDKTEKLFAILSKEKKMASTNTSTSSSILRPRAISDQLTKPLNSYFGGIADSKSLKKAKQLVADGASYGLGGGVLTFKILKAIEILLWEISELYLTDEQRKQKDYQKRTYLLGSNTETNTSGVIKLDQEQTFTGTPIGSPYPCIITTPHNFAKKVKGGVNPSGREINDVIDELNRLEKEKRVIVHNGIVAHTRPLKDVSLYSNNSGQTLLHIVLSPMFAQMIGKKFVRERKDILTLLKGVSKDMTLTLYEILIMKMSLGFSYYHCNPKELSEQIAKLSSYKEKPKRKREDFNYSVEVMKRIRLISEYSETATECKFIFNRNHLQEDFKSYPDTRYSTIKKEPFFDPDGYGSYL